jgi:hypothetical protein
MFTHVFLFKWKPAATPEYKARATEAIRAFQGAIPGLVSTAVGPNVSPRGTGYTFGGVMQFTDRDAFENYMTHPRHQALLGWLVPLVEPIELDLEA